MEETEKSRQTDIGKEAMSPRGRDWSDTEKLSEARGHRKLDEFWKDSAKQVHSPTTLNLHFSPPGLWDNKFLLFSAIKLIIKLVICHKQPQEAHKLFKMA